MHSNQPNEARPFPLLLLRFHKVEDVTQSILEADNLALKVRSYPKQPHTSLHGVQSQRRPKSSLRCLAERVASAMYHTSRYEDSRMWRDDDTPTRRNSMVRISIWCSQKRSSKPCPRLYLFPSPFLGSLAFLRRSMSRSSSVLEKLLADLVR